MCILNLCCYKYETNFTGKFNSFYHDIAKDFVVHKCSCYNTERKIFLYIKYSNISN